MDELTKLALAQDWALLETELKSKSIWDIDRFRCILNNLDIVVPKRIDYIFEEARDFIRETL